MIASSNVSGSNTSTGGVVAQTSTSSSNNSTSSKKRKNDALDISTTANITVTSTAVLGAATTIVTHAHSICLQQPMFWQYNMEQIGAWIRSTVDLFIKQQQHSSAAESTSEDIEKMASSLIQALESVCCSKQQHDKFHILDSTFSRGENVVFTPGTVVSRLNVGGWINGLQGVEGGVVDPAVSVSSLTNNNKLLTQTVEKLSLALHRATSAKVEIDMLESTPRRIIELLCPEVSIQEISNIRRRIYDTVVLGKGIQNQQQNKGEEDDEEDLPVAASITSSEVEKWHKCRNRWCNNNDQSKFASDTKNGDLICTECGMVASENLMHEGSQFRKFEGELDRNHHGDAPNYLYSNAHNLSTTLGTGIGQVTSFKQSTTSSNGQMWGGNKNLENILRNAHAYTEMNISQFGKDERRTRIGYKDRQKKEAFMKMIHVGDALNLHDAVVQRSKELFAGFRDDRELVQQFKGVVAACMWEAFDQLSVDGRNILKIRAGDSSNIASDGEVWNVTRATWRNAMHNTTAASKGTTFSSSSSLAASSNITKTKNTEESKIPTSAIAATAPTISEDNSNNDLDTKPAATWDIDDVRTWLLQTSRSIARQWVYTSSKNAASDEATTASIPTGSLDELEGKLVEYTFKLCDELENEEETNIAGSVINKQRVNTPRVDDMAQLGIKWQSHRERGSGGKGGVGNSGKHAVVLASGNTRTAGQRLILKTSKKLSSIIQDKFAGEAFHKELRNLLARQEERKKQDRMSENANKRFHQMQRKPWILKRLE